MYEQDFFSVIITKRIIPALSDVIKQLYTTAECVFFFLIPSQFVTLIIIVGATFNQTRGIKEENVLWIFENALAYMQVPRK